MSAEVAVQSVAYFDNTYEEAMALAREARDYLAFQEKADLAKMGAVGRMAASCESMRLTARMTQVVAWLLVQKAVHAGDLTREQAAEPNYRLSGQEICISDEPLSDEPARAAPPIASPPETSAVWPSNRSSLNAVGQVASASSLRP